MYKRVDDQNRAYLDLIFDAPGTVEVLAFHKENAVLDISLYRVPDHNSTQLVESKR
jgi:hypothetical protein